LAQQVKRNNLRSDEEKGFGLIVPDGRAKIARSDWPYEMR